MGESTDLRDRRKAPRGAVGRRKAGTGAMFRRDDRWIAKFQGTDGKTHWKSASVIVQGSGEAAAKAADRRARQTVADWLEKVRRDAESGLGVTSDKVTFARYATRWVEGLPSSGLKPSTVEFYERYVHNHLLTSELAGIALAKITPDHLKRFYARKGAEGLSSTSVHHLHAVIHRILGTAARHGVVHRNVASLLDKKERPGVRKLEMRVLQGEQLQGFREAIRGHRFEALFAMAITTGMRQGELLGLCWRNVDLERGEVRVVASLQGPKQSARTIGEPKTGKRSRPIRLPAWVTAALVQHKAEQAEYRLAMGSRWDSPVEDLVFTGESGCFLPVATLTRDFKAILAAAGLPAIRFHDLRHTAATAMLGHGVDLKVVSDMLGHSSVNVTADIYMHPTSEMQIEALRRVWGEA